MGSLFLKAALWHSAADQVPVLKLYLAPARLHEGAGDPLAVLGVFVGKPGGEFTGAQPGVVVLQVIHQACGRFKIARGVEAGHQDKAGQPEIRSHAHRPMGGLQRVLEIPQVEIGKGL